MRRFSSSFWTASLHRLALLHRHALTHTLFVGITGSAGKTTTKDLVASIMESGFGKGLKGEGTSNGPDELARLVLRTRRSDAYCINEIALMNESTMELQLALFRPSVGVVTNVGGDHVAAYGSLDGIAEEKSKLVKSLPADGIAILNADDPRVLAMRAMSSARTVTYGLSQGAMLRGEAVQGAWPDRLALTAAWDGESVRVQTRLCGDHWVPVVLAAMATGAALGVPLSIAAKAVAEVEPYEGRMSSVELDDGVTFIRDDWKAPFWSIAPTFQFMRQARAARKIIVMGSVSDYSGPYTPRYVKIAQQALTIADCVLFVGPRASACLRAKRRGEDRLFAFPSLKNASAFLSEYLRPGDLVLLKGSVRTDHLERLILARTSGVECWRTRCGRAYFCDGCSLLHRVPDVEDTPEAEEPSLRISDDLAGDGNGANLTIPPVIVVGLGNPGQRYAGTRHNIGQLALDILAARLGGVWTGEDELAMIMRTRWQDQPVWLTKLIAPMNESGQALLSLATKLGFTLAQCVLLHDDLDLPVGAVRARYRGGDGGHRGVQSIIETFQEDQVRRVKIGIGRGDESHSSANYVLAPFPSEQHALVDAAIRNASDRVVELMREGLATRSRVTAEERSEKGSILANVSTRAHSSWSSRC